MLVTCKALSAICLALTHVKGQHTSHACLQTPFSSLAYLDPACTHCSCLTVIGRFCQVAKLAALLIDQHITLLTGLFHTACWLDCSQSYARAVQRLECILMMTAQPISVLLSCMPDTLAQVFAILHVVKAAACLHATNALAPNLCKVCRMGASAHLHTIL